MTPAGQAGGQGGSSDFVNIHWRAGHATEARRAPGSAVPGRRHARPAAAVNCRSKAATQPWTFGPLPVDAINRALGIELDSGHARPKAYKQY